jgi:SPX domain protein involved in polyphosphate accumulation
VTLITANDTLYFNVDNSIFNWTGRKVTGEHSGTLKVEDGWVIMQEDSIIGGKFIFDMTSIQNTDIESPEWKQKLEDHLKAEDFFHTDSFPHAILEIKRQTTIIKENKTIHEGVLADLTIRGMTHEIKFSFILTQSKNILTGEGSVDIDRTLYNIQYKSGKFFDDLGDHLIYDDFTVQFRVQTKIK